LFCSSSCAKGLESAEWWVDAIIAIDRGEGELKNNNQAEKVGGDPETMKRCGRRRGNKMTPMTTMMKQQSKSNYHVVEEEQRCRG
jgi:hypothetical protein